MPVTHKLCIAQGTYQDQDGQQKTRWLDVGVAFEKDGKRSLKINALPTFAHRDGQDIPWDGWIRMFPTGDRPGSSRQAQGGGYPTQQASGPLQSPGQPFGDVIPF